MYHKEHWLLVLLLGWSLLAPALAAARTPAVLGPETASLDLAPHVRYLQEAEPRGEPARMFERAQAGEFRPLPPGGPVFGFQRDTFWFHATLLNRNPDEPRWLLVQKYPLSDYVDVYLRHPDGRIEHQASGDRLPFDSRAIRYRTPNFEVRLPPGQPVELLVRVRSESSMQVPLALYTPMAFAELARDAQLGIGIYYGILIALLVYNLVLWLWLRDWSYFWYLFHVGGFGLVLFCLNGLAFEYLWPNSPLMQEWCVPVSICIALAAMQQFARHFLDLEHRWPAANRLSVAFLVFFAVMGVASFALPYRISTPIVSAAVFPNVIFIVTQSVVMLRRGFEPARLFLLAWAVFLAGTAVFAALAFGLLPKNFFTEYGVQMGSALEMLLLSVALGYRYASLRTENIRIVQETNEKLDRTVIERTRQLRTAMAQLGEANVQLREYSRRDPLTGVYNRRHFHEAFEQTLREVAGRNGCLALLLADLDHFKQVNDTYGHLAGDDCLRAAARSLQDALASREAMVARFGGEEFVAVFPCADAQEALQVAESVRMHIHQSPVRSGKHTIRMSISIGVHTVTPGREMTPEELIKVADEALYRAKGDGRNCVRHSMSVA